MAPHGIWAALPPRSLQPPAEQVTLMSAAPKLQKATPPPVTATEAASMTPASLLSPAYAAPGPGGAGSEFARFFEIEWPRLKRYLKRHIGSEDAEDVAQEAFARLFVHKADTRSPSGLLYQTARNLVKDGKRRARRVQAVLVESAPMEMIADPHPSPEEETDFRQRLAQASVLFDRMSPKCRQVFLLRVMEGCSYAEIARQLGMTPIAVEKQLLRGFEICADWSAASGTAKRRRDRLS
jgi:RNA polymerase sigma factor (sigma-70 family)